MTNDIWAQLIIGLATAFIPAIGLAFWLGQQLTRISAQIEAANLRVDSLAEEIKLVRRDLSAGTQQVRNDLSAEMQQAHHDLSVEIQKVRNDLSAEIKQVSDDLHSLSLFIAGLAKEQTTSFGVIITMLQRRGDLTQDELADVGERQAALSNLAVDAFLRREQERPNPLSRQQVDRLQYYVHKARRGESFSAAEVKEYSSIADVIEKEQLSDPGGFALVLLGAFLRGAFSRGPVVPPNHTENAPHRIDIEE